MTFHPSITDIHGCFHLMKHFISILETKLEAPESLQIETNLSKIIPLPHEEQQTHLPIESLLPKAGESSYLKGTKLLFVILFNIIRNFKFQFQFSIFIFYFDLKNYFLWRNRL